MQGDEHRHQQHMAEASVSSSRNSEGAPVGGTSKPATPGSTRRRTSTSHSMASTSASASKDARARGTLGTAGRPPHHRQALSAIRSFLRRESCFDILPESFRLIVFDNKLLIKRALVALQTNGQFGLLGRDCISMHQTPLTSHPKTSGHIQQQASFLLPYTTRRNTALLVCSRWSTSSISSNSTT
jgi:hypothetical protein